MNPLIGIVGDFRPNNEMHVRTGLSAQKVGLDFALSDYQEWVDETATHQHLSLRPADGLSPAD